MCRFRLHVNTHMWDVATLKLMGHWTTTDRTNEHVILNAEKKRVSIDRQPDKEKLKKERKINRQRKGWCRVSLSKSMAVKRKKTFLVFIFPDEIWNPVFKLFSKDGRVRGGSEIGGGWFPDWWPLCEKNLPVFSSQNAYAHITLSFSACPFCCNDFIWMENGWSDNDFQQLFQQKIKAIWKFKSLEYFIFI